MAWHRPKPAQENAMPAMVAAVCTFCRASCAPAKDRGNSAKAMDRASSARASDMGLAPVAAQASSAWLIKSKPVSAISLGGREVSKSLSKIAIWGCNFSSTRGCFTPLWVKIAKSVTSEPEPDVVGTAISRAEVSEK